MKCFLHIGTEKTATTTIQAFFHANRLKLLEKGFIYTKSAGIGNNQALAVAAYDIQKRDLYTRRRGIDSDGKMLAFQQKVIDNLKQEIHEASTKANTIIFSSEHIQSRLTRISEISRLKAILCDLGVTEATIIIYLRRPADIANSLFSTAIKCGDDSLEQPPPPEHPYYANVCHHKNTLIKFSSVFGRSAMVPKIFEKNEFVNHSIIDDINTAIGIPGNTEYFIPANRNESLSPLGVKLLQRLNKDIPALAENQPNPLRANLVAYFSRYFSDSKYVMPRSLYEAYDEAFKVSNDWVREEYFPGKESLFSQSIPKESHIDFSEVDLDRIAAFISQIWKDKQTKINEQLNEVKTHISRA